MVVNTSIKEGGKENGKKLPTRLSFHESDFLTLCSLLDDGEEIICHHKNLFTKSQWCYH